MIAHEYPEETGFDKFLIFDEDKADIFITSRVFVNNVLRL